MKSLLLLSAIGALMVNCLMAQKDLNDLQANIYPKEVYLQYDCSTPSSVAAMHRDQLSDEVIEILCREIVSEINCRENPSLMGCNDSSYY